MGTSSDIRIEPGGGGEQERTSILAILVTFLQLYFPCSLIRNVNCHMFLCAIALNEISGQCIDICMIEVYTMQTPMVTISLNSPPVICLITSHSVIPSPDEAGDDNLCTFSRFLIWFPKPILCLFLATF